MLGSIPKPFARFNVVLLCCSLMGWIVKKQRNTYAYQKIRGLKRKFELIKLKGGKCSSCGYDKNIAALEFHHLDPSQKESKLDTRKLSNSTMENILKEIEKCILVCANCHREIHSPELSLKNVEKLVEKACPSIVSERSVNKPKCLDCGIGVNYLSRRCRKCSDKAKRIVVRPLKSDLLDERKAHGVPWCSLKYKVSQKTIYRWCFKHY